MEPPQDIDIALQSLSGLSVFFVFSRQIVVCRKRLSFQSSRNHHDLFNTLSKLSSEFPMLSGGASKKNEGEADCASWIVDS